MTGNIAVSFVIPIYNKEDYIRECLMSVTSQTLSDIEILCVDNNSSDGSMEIVREFAATDPRIRLLRETDQGLPQARNCALACAQGEFVVFVDADDFVDTRLAELAVESARTNGSDVVLYSFARNFNDDDHFTRACSAVLGSGVMDARQMNEKDTPFISPSACTKLFRRSFLSEQGIRFDPELKQAEDLLFSYSAILAASAISEVEQPVLYYYRKNVNNSMMTDRADASKSIMVLEAYKKLDAWMQGRNMGDVYETAFLRRLLTEIDYSFELAKDGVGFAAFYNEFRSLYRSRFLASSGLPLKNMPSYQAYIEPETIEASMFAKAKQADRLQKAQSAEANREIRKVKKERDKLHRETKRIRQSRSYRMSRILIKPFGIMRALAKRSSAASKK